MTAPEMVADYGINERTGQPYKVSPEERAARAARLEKARAAKKARATTGRASGSRTGSRKDRTPHQTYTMTVAGLAQIVSVVIAWAGRAFKSTPLLLDSIAVSQHSEPVAVAVADIAVEDSRWAAVLERVGSVGPYSGLFLAGMGLGLQVAANHGAIPPSPEQGIMSAEELLATAGVEMSYAPASEDDPVTAGDVPPDGVRDSAF